MSDYELSKNDLRQSHYVKPKSSVQGKTPDNKSHTLRGHRIYSKNRTWYYQDTDEPTVGNRRECGYCKKPDTKDGHDPCLGELPGVMNACCGHGTKNESYIQFENGVIVRGFRLEEKGQGE